MSAPHGSDSGRLLEKLIRETLRSEAQAVDYPVRETKRIGEAPPVVALHEVATHAAGMRTRLLAVLNDNEVPINKGSLGATLASLRHLVVDRVSDPERSFRTALLELRHGLDAVKLLRDVARRVELFGVIRWCDDWLGARRTLVARVEAQLVWFTEQETRARSSLPSSVELPSQRMADEAIEDDCDVLTSAVDPTIKPSASRSWHTDRST